jgi:hypothetical protein
MPPTILNEKNTNGITFEYGTLVPYGSFENLIFINLNPIPKKKNKIERLNAS